MLKNLKKKDPIVAFARRVAADYQNQGDQFVSPENTQHMLGFESLDLGQRENLTDKLEGLVEQMKGNLTELAQDGSFGMEAFGDLNTEDGQRRLEVAAQSAAVAAMAAGDVTGYAQRAYTIDASEAPGVRSVPLNTAGTDYRLGAPAMEAFDERELSAHLPYSITFAAFAARQDEFSETFFPTAVVTPDQAGLDIEVTIPKVFTNSRHGMDGKPTDFDRRNLIDAVVDADILSDEATRLVPVVQANGEGADKFVPESLVGTSYFRLSGFDVPTRPLATGKEVNLIGISNYAPLIGAGVLNNTDAVDSSILLQDLYVDFGGADEAAVRFSVTHQPRNAFVKSVEGNYREMNLQFTSRSLIINKDKLATDGARPAAFQAIVDNDWTVHLAVSMNGVFNTEFGNVKVQGYPVTVDLIQDANGNEISLTAGAGAALVAELEAGKIIGYNLKCNRTNSNLRTRGHVVDSTIERERHTIPLGSPITYPSPVHAQGRDADIKVAINAARTRNSNLAVTTLLSYADALENVVKGPKRRDGVIPAIAGAGRWVVQPWFERQKLDLTASINSEKSFERAADIALTLVNAIRDMAYRAYRDSRYQAALDAQTSGSGERPTLIIGTDPVIERHLMVAGDDRTFGTAFDKFKVVSSLDKRTYGKIFLTFSRGTADPSDVLSFGTHAWMPELTSSLPINRQGATYREAMVQPRNLHVPKLPILGIIEVQGLSKALTDKTSVLMVGPSDITNPWLPGLGA